MVSVGLLAALINVALLVVVSVADRAIEHIVRRFAAARLQRHRSAPVVHDSDTWLPNIPRSILKYRRQPAILITILFATLLVASELVTELGVEVSEKCSLRLKKGRVIGKDIHGHLTPVEHGASAFLLQTIEFLDGPLTRVADGMPVRLTSRVCLSCFDAKNASDLIASDCTVQKTREYPPGALNVLVRTTRSSFFSISAGFEDLSLPPNQDRLLHGMGDLTNNGEHFEIFTFYNVSAPSQGDGIPTDTRSWTDATTATTWQQAGDTARQQQPPSPMRAVYLAYNHDAHILELAKRSSAAAKTTSNPDGMIVSDVSRGPVRAYEISCGVNQLTGEEFLTTLQVYRTMQLENTIAPAFFNGSGNSGNFAPMRGEDVLRSVLALKVIEDEARDGSFHEYVQCATYKWIFILPFAFSLFGLILLAAFAAYSAPLDVVRGVPYNSSSWFRQAAEQSAATSARARGGAGAAPGESMRAALRRAMSGSYWRGEEDTMVLKHDGDTMWIEVQSQVDSRCMAGFNLGDVPGGGFRGDEGPGVYGAGNAGVGNELVASMGSGDAMAHGAASGAVFRAHSGGGTAYDDVGGMNRDGYGGHGGHGGRASVGHVYNSNLAATNNSTINNGAFVARGGGGGVLPGTAVATPAAPAGHEVGPQWDGMPPMGWRPMRFRQVASLPVVGIDSVTRPDCVYRSGTGAAIWARQEQRDAGRATAATVTPRHSAPALSRRWSDVDEDNVDDVDDDEYVVVNDGGAIQAPRVQRDAGQATAAAWPPSHSAPAWARRWSDVDDDEYGVGKDGGARQAPRVQRDVGRVRAVAANARHSAPAWARRRSDVDDDDEYVVGNAGGAIGAWRRQSEEAGEVRRRERQGSQQQPELRSEPEEEAQVWTERRAPH